jgi:hypothetical protein
MFRVAGVLSVSLIFSLSPAAAQQYPQYRRGGPPPAAQEECPQGRQIRAQKAYPSTMTDCEVLDADTAAENQKRQRRPVPPPVAQQPLNPPAPKSVTPAAVVSPATQTPIPPPAPAAPSVQAPIQRTTPSEPIHADYDARMVGNWLTSAKEDRFGDGGAFIAVTGDGGIAIAVRCIQKTLTIGIMQVGDDPKPIQKGDLFLFKFRVDTQPVVETGGVAIGDRLVQVVTEKALVKSIRDGKETAVRLEDNRGVSSTHVFNTRGARAAFADLSRECPLD